MQQSLQSHSYPSADKGLTSGGTLEQPAYAILHW